MVHCSALQSLHLDIDTPSSAYLRLSDCVPLTPHLSQLTVFVNVDRDDGAPATELLSLPATLTYLQVRGYCKLLVLSQPAAVEPVDLHHAALPPSLLCLSLALPSTSTTDALVSSLLSQCPLLTQCYIGPAGLYCDTENDERSHWTQKLEVLIDQLDEEVWCEDEKEVEQQRLDRRWQRVVGVNVMDY